MIGVAVGNCAEQGSEELLNQCGLTATSLPERSRLLTEIAKLPPCEHGPLIATRAVALAATALHEILRGQCHQNPEDRSTALEVQQSLFYTVIKFFGQVKDENVVKLSAELIENLVQSPQTSDYYTDGGFTPKDFITQFIPMLRQLNLPTEFQDQIIIDIYTALESCFLDPGRPLSLRTLSGEVLLACGSSLPIDTGKLQTLWQDPYENIELRVTALKAAAMSEELTPLEINTIGGLIDLGVNVGQHHATTQSGADSEDNHYLRLGAASVLTGLGERAIPTLMRLIALGNPATSEVAARAISAIPIEEKRISSKEHCDQLLRVMADIMRRYSSEEQLRAKICLIEAISSFAERSSAAYDQLVFEIDRHIAKRHVLYSPGSPLVVGACCVALAQSGRPDAFKKVEKAFDLCRSDRNAYLKWATAMSTFCRTLQNSEILARAFRDVHRLPASVKHTLHSAALSDLAIGWSKLRDESESKTYLKDLRLATMALAKVVECQLNGRLPHILSSNDLREAVSLLDNSATIAEEEGVRTIAERGCQEVAAGLNAKILSAAVSKLCYQDARDASETLLTWYHLHAGGVERLRLMVSLDEIAGLDKNTPFIDFDAVLELFSELDLLRDKEIDKLLRNLKRRAEILSKRDLDKQDERDRKSYLRFSQDLDRLVWIADHSVRFDYWDRGQRIARRLSRIANVPENSNTALASQLLKTAESIHGNAFLAVSKQIKFSA